MKKDLMPLCVCFVKETKKGLKYEMGDCDVDIELSAKDKKVAIDFLYLCNGRETLLKIAEELKVKITRLFPLVNILIKHKVIFDSKELFKFYHEASTLPGKFIHSSSKNNYISFCGEVIPINKILNVLGNLVLQKTNQMFELYITLNHNYKKYDAGLYKYDRYKNKLIKLSQNKGEKHNRFIFATNIADKSSVIIYIVAKNNFSNDYYANREYRYLFIEAGKLTQKAGQLESKLGVKILECGEFNDKALSLYLGLRESEFCCTSLILGRETKINNSQFNLEDKVTKIGNFLNKKKIIRSIEVRSYQNKKYTMQKYATLATAFGSARSKNGYTSCGVASTLAESKLKCLVEMYERYCCGRMRVDKEIIFKKQKNFYSISCSSPQNDSFLKKKKLQRIGLGEKVKCVNALDLLSNKKYIVPVDEVFYPIKNPKFYKANSSGVAAHFEKKLAIENALYELIERDAVLVTWYTKKVPSILVNNFLSEEIRQRVVDLEQKGVKVNFLDITLDSCAVVLCLIQNKNYPKTSVGCSANVEIDKAIEKSLDEAELMLNSWNEETESKRIVNIESVENVIDHGNIFARFDLKNTEYKWILLGEKVNEIKQKATEFQRLIEKFEPIVVEVNKKKDLGLHVVRVMSKKLIPITFGYGAEHYGHNRLKGLDLKWGSEYPSLPHFIP